MIRATALSGSNTKIFQTYAKHIHSTVIGIFALMSMVPGNALAFETQLNHSQANALIAPVEIDRETTPVSRVYAASAPVTLTTKIAVWPEAAVSAPKPRIVPTLTAPVVLEGEASYYSRAGCLGCDPQMIMANGQPLNDGALTMAIGADKKHLVGYNARVTNLATGQSVVVKITDTGGFYQEKYGSRVADLTIATKEAIGIRGGLGQVKVEVF